VLSGLCNVNFLQGSSSCTLKRCPSHFNLPIFSLWLCPVHCGAYETH
jgi:hypothetical protein